jgi:hypothetical protein
MTFLAALRHDRIEAPWFLEGPIDGDSFRLYVERFPIVASCFTATIAATALSANYRALDGANVAVCVDQLRIESGF